MRRLIICVLISLLCSVSLFADNMEGPPMSGTNVPNGAPTSPSTTSKAVNQQLITNFFKDDKYKKLTKYKTTKMFRIQGKD